MRANIVSFLLLASYGFTTAVPGLLIPLYSYPTGNGDVIWKSVRQSSIENPSVPFLVVVNPNSGPGNKKDDVYASAVKSLVSAKIKCIGYVRTDYSKVPLSNVTKNMDRYKMWYPQISGFFLDEMAHDGSHESYYSSLTSHAVRLGYPFTVGNPGTSTTKGYFQTVNTTVIYETNFLPKPSALNQDFPASRCSMIAYNVQSSSLNQTYINAITRFVSHVYITDDVLNNPYDKLPTYFNQLIKYLSAARSTSEEEM